MAEIGSFFSPVKRFLGRQQVTAPDGASANVLLTHPDQLGLASNYYVTCMITTTGNTYVNWPGGSNIAATTDSFLLTSDDRLYVRISSGSYIAFRGSGGERTVTIVKVNS